MNPLNPLYYAVAWVIMRINGALGTIMSPGGGLAWVLTLVILVILMRLLLVPLFVKQMHATRKMSALAPQMQELRKKYKNDRQTLNEQTMKLYKDNGVNPLGGCLPLVAQLPLFFALFGVLRAISGWHPGLPLPYGFTESVITSAQHADIFGATIGDKFLFAPPGESVQAKIVIGLTVVVSVVTTYLTVRQSTKRGLTPQMTPDNPMAASQKYMQYIVPFFALSGLYWAFGLVLYWMTTNLWTLGQQYVLFKRYPGLTAAGGTAAGAATGTAAGTGATATPFAPPGQARRKRGTGGQAKPGDGPARPAAGDGKPSAGDGKSGPGGRRPGEGSGRPGAGPARPSGARPKPAAGPAKPSGTAKPGSTGKPAAGPAKPAGGRPTPAEQRPAANGSGFLRRLGKRSEPEPQPETPEVKLVRQQRVRQSRSKRSGKR